MEVIKPSRSPQKGEPIFKRMKSEIVTIKEMSAPRVKCPLKAAEKLLLRTFKRAIPIRVAINAVGVASIRVVTIGEINPNIITPKHTRVAAVY